MSVNLKKIKEQLSDLKTIINNLITFCNSNNNALFIKDLCLHKINQSKDVLETIENNYNNFLLTNRLRNKENSENYHTFNEEEHTHREPNIFKTYINTNFIQLTNNKDKLNSAIANIESILKGITNSVQRMIVRALVEDVSSSVSLSTNDLQEKQEMIFNNWKFNILPTDVFRKEIIQIELL